MGLPISQAPTNASSSHQGISWRILHLIHIERCVSVKKPLAYVLVSYLQQSTASTHPLTSLGIGNGATLHNAEVLFLGLQSPLGSYLGHLLHATQQVLPQALHLRV